MPDDPNDTVPAAAAGGDAPPPPPPPQDPPPVPPPQPQPDPAAAATPQPATSAQKARDKLLERDLNEVYLVLDFVSGRPERRLGELTMPDPTKDDGTIWKSSEIVRQIALIRYPPKKPATEEDEAQQAAVLLMAKDALSQLASPARGATIAYTAMYVEAEAQPGPILRFGRSVRRHARRGHQEPQVESPEDQTGSLADLAQRTFPHYQEHVARFRFFRRWFIWLAFLVLVVTVQTSWDVAHTRAVVQRLDQTTKDRNTIYQANPDLMKSGVCPVYDPKDSKPPVDIQGPATTSSAGTTPSAGTTSSAGTTLSPGITPTPGTNAGPAAKDWTADSKTVIPCSQLWYLAQHEAEGRLDLDRIFRCNGAWCNTYLHVLYWGFVLCSGPELTEPPGQASNHIGWQSATSILMVFTTYVLPMLYGLLGTIIGAFRAIQQKVRDSELAPRDFGLTILGLPLGAVAGIVVGLFFAPLTAPIQGAGGIAGDLTLTASGLGFLAGYGSQSFFAFVDHLLEKIFPGDTPHQPPPNPAR